MGKDRTAERYERYEQAAAWRAAGHTSYAHTGQVVNVRDFGPKTDLAADIEAIESAGWRLEHAAWSGVGVLLVFRAARPEDVMIAHPGVTS
jgi:hypothetical protein